MQHDFYGLVMLVLTSQDAGGTINSTIALLVQNDMQNDFFSHLIVLELASSSHDVKDIVCSTTAFIRSR